MIRLFSIATAVLAFGCILSSASCNAQVQAGQAGLYQSPISDSMNVRFVENRIEIDRPAKAVFDWVTTWSNLPKWLPVAHEVAVVRGQPDMPSKLGDVLVEIVNPANTAGVNKQYTVVAEIDDFLWTVAGQDIVNGKPSGRIQYVATFAVSPTGPESCIFTRVFQTIRADEVNSSERHAVDKPEVIQKALVRLKATIETAIHK